MEPISGRNILRLLRMFKSGRLFLAQSQVSIYKNDGRVYILDKRNGSWECKLLGEGDACTYSRRTRQTAVQTRMLPMIVPKMMVKRAALIKMVSVRL